MLSRLRPDNEDESIRARRRVAPSVTVNINQRSSAGRPRPTDADRAGTKRKRRTGTTAIREIRRLQASTDLLIPKLPFARVVKDVCGEITPDIKK